jgi:hypothetical protein
VVCVAVDDCDALPKGAPLPSSPISPYSIASQSPTTKNRQQQRNVIRLPTFKGQFEDGPGFPLALAATATAADVVTKRKQEKRIREKGDKKKKSPLARERTGVGISFLSPCSSSSLAVHLLHCEMKRNDARFVFLTAHVYTSAKIRADDRFLPRCSYVVAMLQY